MSVTILYQGAKLTFPDIDDPNEAYRRLQMSSGGASPTAPSFDKKNIKDGIDPDLLRENKDWLSASKVLYDRTQGSRFNGSDKELADWGLDRMARFSYNLPLMGADAVALKSAPKDQQDAFLFMLDSFDKVAYSWGGAGNFIKYMALDPTNLVGLSTFGIGTAASQSAKFTTKEGLKAALKVGALGAVEGGIYGGAQQRIEQEARVNAGGQAEVDYGKVAEGAGLGAVAGGLLAPVASSVINGIRKGPLEAPRKVADEVPAPPVGNVASEASVPPIAPSPTTTMQQQSLNLGDMADPIQAAQARMDRADAEGRLGVSLQAGQGDLIDNLPYERRLDQLPEGLRPPVQETMSDMTDRLSAKWGVDHQQQLDLGGPTQGPYAYAGQGELFPTDPTKFVTIKPAVDKFNEPIRFPEGHPRAGEVMNEEIRGAGISMVEEEARRAISDTQPPKAVKQTEALVEKMSPPSPKERIGGENGPTFSDLRQLLADITSNVEGSVFRSWERMMKASDPMRRALINMTPNEAKDIAKELMASALTDKERQVLLDAALRSQNTVADISRGYMRDIELATSKEMKDKLRDQMLEAEKIFSPLKLLAQESISTAGRMLQKGKLNEFKGEYFKVTVDSILRADNIDPKTATADQRAKAFNALLERAVESFEKVDSDNRVKDLRRRISDATIDGNGNEEIHKLWEEMAELKRTIEDERRAELTGLGQIGDAWHKVAGQIGYYAAATVLSPGSVTVNVISNALRTFTRPMMDYMTRGPLEYAAFREMTQTYSAMYSVSRRSLQMARKAFDLESSLLSGTDSKWLEKHASQLGQNQNDVVRFIDRNGVRVWLRMLNATDEMFQQMAYHGYVEGNAVAEAIRKATADGLSASEREALVKTALQEVNAKAYNTQIDSTVIGMLREAGNKKGYVGDELKLFVQNELQKNPDMFRRASDEQGIAYTNDLLFKTEFSGEGAASAIAKGYEAMVQRHPEFRLLGQLFFRTPVRVFESGIRMTPILQAMAPKFISDVMGKNGPARELRAHGELLFSYAFAAAVITAWSTGKLTGDGGNIDYREKRNLENTNNWKPYSIKVGDTYVTYRNYDPFSTPIKIMVNALERLQKLDYQKAQGVFEQKGEHKEILQAFGVAANSVAQAIRDANLTSGIDDAFKFVDALSDPDRNETKFLQLFQSKAQLAVPNVIRKGVKSFGEGENVANDPRTTDQALAAIINPASSQVTHQYDALGFKRNVGSQGLFAFFGIDMSNKEERGRGLSSNDQYSLREIAKMTVATSDRFIPQFKSKWYGDKDLRELTTSDGKTTVYNRAMEEFNKNMPNYAYQFLRTTENVPMGRPGFKGPRVTEFDKLQQKIWDMSVSIVQTNDMNAFNLRQKNQMFKFEALSGQREIGSPLFQ